MNARARPAQKKMCVLLAEDDEAMRSFLAEILREEGFDVIEATNGRELFWCMEQASHAPTVDAVISDLRMPAYDGLSVVEAWSAAGGGPPVLLMSAFPDPDARERARRLGVVLLEKPFDVRRMVELVRAMTSKKGALS